ncbi:MAG TPA: hypothetical protein VEC02_03240 [Nitrososphaerales archaeon]|nr:hypothetical protein [Nitrososphaerales archaeon]
MAEKPTAAFVLSLIGGIIYLLVGIVIAVIAAFLGALASFADMGAVGLGVAAVGAVGLVCGIIMIIGAVMMNSSERSRVRTGAILVLILTIVGAFFTIGGFVIGFILALIGSILGLTWKPTVSMPPPPAPPS